MKTDTTKEEVARLITGGMRQISPRQLRNEIDLLGYEIDTKMCFSYINSANEVTYKARSISYRHKASGKRYAHIEAPRETLPELQQIRRNCFVLNNGRIWEL